MAASGRGGAAALPGRLAPGLTVGLAAIFALRRLDNIDTWWHLAAGRWIVQHGRVPAHDTLSSTVPDHAWVNVQWLFDVVLYLLHSLGGPSLLVVAAALCYGAATGLLLVNVRRHVGDVPTALLGLWTVLIAQERFTIRPEMVTYLLLQVILWLYATGRRPNDRRLWALPVVMAVWANCHSLFVVGAVVILCQIAGTIVAGTRLVPSGWRRPVHPAVRNRIVITGLAGLVALVLNPFGVRGAIFPLALLGRFDRSHLFVRAVGEFQPPFSGYLPNLAVGAYQALFACASVVVAAALVVSAVGWRAPGADPTRPSRAERRRAERGGLPSPGAPTTEAARVDLADAAVFVGVAYLSVLARRNMALFAMAGLPCVASALAVLAAAAPAVMRRGLRGIERAVAIVLVPLVVGGGWWVASNGFYRWNGDAHETGLGTLNLYAPVRAAAFVEAQRLPGPWFNDLTTGGYLTWARPIPGGVYVDGRLEVYEAEFLDKYLRQLADVGRWQAEMDRRGVQTAITFHGWGNLRRLVRHLLTDPRWAPVYYDEVALVAVRREGNDAVIRRAREAFRPARERTERRLLAARPSWQAPIWRARALRQYAGMLDALGKRREAARYRAAFADL